MCLSCLQHITSKYIVVRCTEPTEAVIRSVLVGWVRLKDVT
jgi:hypothetical protein